VHIAVCIKQVPDTETRIKINDDKKSIREEDINFILNPFDEFAVEEALRIKETRGGDVTVISLGPDRVSSAIRSALAMGADKAIRINLPVIPLDAQVTAMALAQVLQEEHYDLILTGKQAIDDDQAQMPSLLAEFLNLPAINVVTRLTLDVNTVTAERQIEGGLERVTCNLPAIISAQRGLNEPRYASLKGIMASKRIQIQEKKVDPAAELIEIRTFNYPPQKPPGRIVGSGPAAVPELLRLLRDEAKVLI
jgi:electron transfer flavoprotein beta subunit